MKKTIIITLCLIVTLLTTSVVFAMGDGVTKAESEDQELIHVDMKALNLNKSKKSEWDKGFVTNVRKATKNISSTPEDLKHNLLLMAIIYLSI